MDPWIQRRFAGEISYKVRCHSGTLVLDVLVVVLIVPLWFDRYRWDQSPSFLYMDVFPPSAATFTVTGLQAATTYNFSVNALNAMGESSYADNNAVLTITTKGQFGVTTAWH